MEEVHGSANLFNAEAHTCHWQAGEEWQLNWGELFFFFGEYLLVGRWVSVDFLSLVPPLLLNARTRVRKTPVLPTRGGSTCTRTYIHDATYTRY